MRPLLDKPLVVFFDEADCLSEGTLITFLRQLRDGYVNMVRMPFIHCVALVGMRNIRDYKGKIRKDTETMGTASPFNIIRDALTLKNFKLTEIQALYEQHTKETGQIFEPEAIERVYFWTDGQPWLVNAIAAEVIERQLKKDFTKVITLEMVDIAVQTIILRRDVHIDSLLERLHEERVRRILEPVIIGKENAISLNSEYTLYCLDLGLLKMGNGEFTVSNRIYREVFLYGSRTEQDGLEQLGKYMDKSGEHEGWLVIFDRENGKPWREKIYWKTLDLQQGRIHVVGC